MATTLESASREQLDKVLIMLEHFTMLEGVQKYFRDVGGLHEYPGAVLSGERVILIISGSITDWQAWHDLRKESADFLQRYDQTRVPLDKDHYFALLRKFWEKYFRGTEYAYQIFLRGADRKPGELIGGICLGEIRGSQGTIGYWVGEHCARLGYMTEAARLVCDFAFGKLELHRLEASCAPGNVPSIGLLKKLGFVEAGAADKAYLNGCYHEQIMMRLAAPSI